jgi:hypothetical protein
MSVGGAEALLNSLLRLRVELRRVANDLKTSVERGDAVEDGDECNTKKYEIIIPLCQKAEDKLCLCVCFLLKGFVTMLT